MSHPLYHQRILRLAARHCHFSELEISLQNSSLTSSRLPLLHPWYGRFPGHLHHLRYLRFPGPRHRLFRT